MVSTLMLSLCASAQKRSTGNAMSLGNCSPAVSGDGNRIVVSCTDKRSEQAILNILTKISKSQVPPGEILEKLNIILDEVRANKPRHLTKPQMDSIAEILRPLAGTIASVRCDGLDDSCDYADDFLVAIKKAGFKQGSWDEKEIDAPLWVPVRSDKPWNTKGVYITVDDKLSDTEAGGAAIKQFLAYLAQENIQVDKLERGRQSANTTDLPKFFIFIGRKPLDVGDTKKP